MSLRMMELGGCAMKTGVLTITRCTSARYSLPPGHNSPSLENGKVTLLEVPTHQVLIEMKNLRKAMKNKIAMTVGSITLNSE